MVNNSSLERQANEEMQRHGRVNDGQTKKNLEFFDKSNTPSTSSTSNGFEGIDPALIQHEVSTQPDILPDALISVKKSESGEKKSLIIESKAALIVKEALSGYFAHDMGSQTWHKFVGTHWLPLDAPQFFDNELIRLLYDGTGELGFKPTYKNGIKLLLADGHMLPLPKIDNEKLPFTNGLLNLHTRELDPITSKNAMTWCLPYKYEYGADCPNIKYWLLQAVDGDKESVQFLHAFMAAILHGRNDLQKFLHLKGSGGTGKGTFMRLVTALVGLDNTASTSLQHLEQNRFETALLYNKRLAVITESDKYGGSINVLKAITGQDHIRLERKHQQQAGSFIFPGLVIIASNESLQVTDHTSGLDRRRITVIFDRRATDEEKQEWAKRGGEKAVLHAELPGLVNWLLKLSQDEISNIIRNPPKRISDADREAMTTSNPIADWVLECCVFDITARTQIGDKREIREPGYETRYQNADQWLYPNYLRWSQRNNKPSLSSRRFSELLIQTCTTLGHKVEKHRSGMGRSINGLKLITTF
jgi:putative DNA primase/helicase